MTIQEPRRSEALLAERRCAMNAAHEAFSDALRVISGDARQEADRLAADRARNVNKAERYYDAAERRDLQAQINHDAAINNYGSGRGTL